MFRNKSESGPRCGSGGFVRPGALRAGGWSVVLGILLGAAGAATAAEWTFWRGPAGNGSSPETGLISQWSESGENLIWRAPFIGRSTPVVVDGQVCAIGRVGEGVDRQEVVACYDARDGKLRWEHRHNVYLTTVPFNRVGWSSLAADPETGAIYAQGVAGRLIAFDHDGKILWSYSLAEEFGHLSGYGGRTQTPQVDGDLLIVNFVSTAWGPTAPLRHRYYAFDKRSGELVWVSTPGQMAKDFNTQSVPVVATIGGRRMLVAGNADGHVYGMDLASGEKIWSFSLSKRGLNSSVVVDGDRVYASHSEENIDTPTMGRVVCFNGDGTGDLTESAEIWRIDEMSAGFPSPALHDGKLYVVDNSANLHAVDAKTGAQLWTISLGTVGKGSPVVADGKIFVTETNGRIHIIQPGANAAKALDVDELKAEGDRYAEIYGSPAVAYGRVYFTTEGGLYCLGNKSAGYTGPKQPAHRPPIERAKPGQGAMTWFHVVPADRIVRPGETVTFHVRAVDSSGRVVQSGAQSWSLDRLRGTLDNGRFTPDAKVPFQTGSVKVQVGDKTAMAAVRVIRDLPWSEDFENYAPDQSPTTWIGAAGKYVVQDLDGNKVLAKPPRERGLNRTYLYMGPASLHDYTIEADVMGGAHKRRRPDIGLIAQGYILDLRGAHQKLQLRSWSSALRIDQAVDFPWEMETWYHMKLRVDTRGGKALIRGKAWPKSAPEPTDWMITVEDPHPIPSGSPGLLGYSPVDLFYDNLKVTVNK